LTLITVDDLLVVVPAIDGVPFDILLIAHIALIIAIIQIRSRPKSREEKKKVVSETWVDLDRSSK
jgi:hypothetical protein